MKPIAIRLNDGLVKKLDEVAQRTLSSRSEVIRSALSVYFALLDNIGFYFKPSLPIKNIDLYFDRNVAYFDLGNFVSVAAMSVTYGGVGEKDSDDKIQLEVVAEVMASQLFVESSCRFVNPLVILLSTGNDFEYSLKFFNLFKKAVEKRMSSKIFLVGHEDVFSTFQSFFSATLIGTRDLSVKNTPERGDNIYLWGKVLKKRILIEDLPKPSDVVKIVGLVKSGIASAVFPVKIDGFAQVASYAASLAGGKLRLYHDPGGCPATAILICSKNDLSNYGCEKLGEIL